MRRIKNSIKAIIIVVLTVVVALGVIVGVVLANRDKKNDPITPPGGNNPPSVELTELEQLAEDINSETETANIEVLDNVPYIQFGIDSTKIKAYGKNYFVYLTTPIGNAEPQERFVVFKLNNDGETYTFRDLTNTRNESQTTSPFHEYGDGVVENDAETYYIMDYDDEFVIIASEMNDERAESQTGKYLAVSIVYFDTDTPVEVCAFKAMDAIREHYEIVLQTGCFAVHGYTGFSDTEDSFSDTYTYIYEIVKLSKSKFDYNNNILCSIQENFDTNEPDNNYYFGGSNEILFLYENSQIKLYYNNGSSISESKCDIEIEKDREVKFSVSEVASKAILIEKRTALLDNEDANDAVYENGEFYNYTYYLARAVDGRIVVEELKLKNGYKKVYNTFFVGEQTFCIVQTNLSDNDGFSGYAGSSKDQENTPSYIYQYYNNSGELIVEYSSYETTERIIKSDGKNFLTNRKLFAVNENKQTTNKIIFDDFNASYESANFKSDLFACRYKGKLGIMRLDGTLLFDVYNMRNSKGENIYFSQFYDENDGYVIAKDNSNEKLYYLINLKSGNIEKTIEDPILDSNTKQLLNCGIYILSEVIETQQTMENGTIVKQGYNSEVNNLYITNKRIVENVERILISTETYNDENVKNNTLLDVYSNGGYTSTINIGNKRLRFNDTIVSFNFIENYISPYWSVAAYETITATGGSAYAEWDLDPVDHHTWARRSTNCRIQITVNEGYCPNGIVVKFERHLLSSRYAKFNATYENEYLMCIGDDSSTAWVFTNSYTRTYEISYSMCNAIGISWDGDGYFEKIKLNVDAYIDGQKSSTYSKEKVISYGSTFYPSNVLDIPTKVGYTFQYWGDSGNKEIRSVTAVKSNQSVYAVFAPIAYEISVVLGGDTDAQIGENSYVKNSNNTQYLTGSSVTNVSVEYTAEIKLNVPTRPGYIFDGWTIGNVQCRGTETVATLTSPWPHPTTDIHYRPYGSISLGDGQTLNTYTYFYDDNGLPAIANPSFKEMHKKLVALTAQYNIKIDDQTVEKSSATFGEGDGYHVMCTSYFGMQCDAGQVVTFTANWKPIKYSFQIELAAGNLRSGQINLNGYSFDVVQNDPDHADSVKFNFGQYSSVYSFLNVQSLPSNWVNSTSSSSNSTFVKISNSELKVNYQNNANKEVLSLLYSNTAAESISVNTDSYTVSGFAIRPSGSISKWYYYGRRNGVITSNSSGFRFSDYAKDHSNQEYETIYVYALYDNKDYYVGFYSNYSEGASLTNTNNYLNGNLNYNTNSNGTTKLAFYDPSVNLFRNFSDDYLRESSNPKISNYITNSEYLTNISNNLLNFASDFYNFNKTKSTLKIINIGSGNKIGMQYKIHQKDEKSFEAQNYFTFKQVVIYDYPVMVSSSSYILTTIGCTISGVGKNIQFVSFTQSPYYTITQTDPTQCIINKDQQNEITLTLDTTNNQITILIKNCNYGAQINANNNYSKSINSTIVRSSNAWYGFNIFVDVEAQNAGTKTISTDGNSADGSFETWYVTNALDDRNPDGTNALLVWLGGKVYKISYPTANTFNKISLPEVGKTVYAYKDGTNYFVFYSGRDFYVNINNSEITAITPSQSKVKLYDKPYENAGSTNNSGQYELLTYLSQISFGSSGSSTDRLTLTRDLNSLDTTGRNKLVLGGTLNATELTAGNLNYFSEDGIPGDYQYSKLFYADKSNNDKKFILYLVYNTSNNYIRYFLISDSNNTTNDYRVDTVSLTFSNYNNEVNFNVNDTNNGNDYYSTSDKTALTIDYSYNAPLNSSDPNALKSMFASSSKYADKISSVRPYDLYMFKITPKNGYIIKSIKISYGSTEICNWQLSGISPNNSFSFMSTSGGGVTSIASNIKYRGSSKEYYPYSPDNYHFGIRYSDNGNFTWSISPKDFETFYLMIAGIYESVSVSIETISYVEFDLSIVDTFNNPFNLKDFVFEDETGHRLVGNDGDYEIDASKTSLLITNDSLKNDIYIVNCADSIINSYKRFVFLGVADKFVGNNTYNLYAAGIDNGLAISSLRFIGNKSLSEDALNSISDKARGEDLLKIKFSISSLFATSPDGESNEDIKYINAQKYLLAINLEQLSTTVTTSSYLYNSSLNETDRDFVYNNQNYQLDDNSKKYSWFNDTVLTNIQRDAYTAIGSLTSVNWQNSILTSNSVTTDGYGLSYVYNEIPGYYLDYIIITLDDTEMPIYIYDTLRRNSTATFVLTPTSSSDSTSYSIYIKLSYESNKLGLAQTLGLYTLELYNDESQKQSIDMLQFSSIDVKFLSKPYTIQFKYNQYRGINTDSKLKQGTGNLDRNIRPDPNGSVTSTYGYYYYDNINTVLDYTPTLQGYTLLGWGSMDYYDGNSISSRYSNNNLKGNVWNTSCSFIKVDDLFTPSKREELLTDSGMLESSTYAFYPVGARFVTDTGYSKAGGMTENYNFWYNYYSTFANSYFNQVGGNGYLYNYCIDLYAIWKANTYMVKFDFNDGGSTKVNGSTISQIGFVDRILSGDSAAYEFMTHNQSVITNSITFGGSDSQTFYAFVTFDTNNWFVTDADNFASYYNSYYQDNNNRQYLFNDNNNMLAYVLDRYGYSWLGWFDTAFESNMASTIARSNISSESYFNSSVIFGSNYSNYMNEYTMPILNADRLDRFVNAKQTNDDVLNKVYYLNRNNITEDVPPMSRRNGSYFYKYENIPRTYVSLNGVPAVDSFYLTPNYLNEWRVDSDEMSGSNATLMYFDTMFSEQLYSAVGKPNLNFDNEQNYRYVTLVANWQINRYKLKFDFADNSSASETRYGSSAVTNSNIVDSASQYYDFDSTALNDFLMKTNLTRVGYDFIGWAFRYDTTPTDTANGSIYLYANKYVLNNDLLRYYTSNVLYLDNVDPNVNQWNDDKFEYITHDVSSNSGLVFLTAVWRAQEFKINISVDANELYNALNKDSAFTLGFYNYINGTGEKIVDYSTYLGIAKSNLTYNNTDGDYNNKLVNINYTLIFDQSFDKAVIRFNYNDRNYEFGLADLFAVSSGYDFLGWLIAPNGDESVETIISNTKQTMFSDNLDSINSNINGSVTSGSELIFNYDLYLKLTNLSYGSDTLNKLIDRETPSGRESLDNYEVTSSSFGKVNGNPLYCEDVMSSGLIEHVLYYKDNQGIKNYVVLYIVSDDQTIYIDNDHTTLRLNGNIIYFDKDDKPYYVVGETLTYIDAIFAKTYNINANTPSNALPTPPSKDTIKNSGISGVMFTPFSSREFTIYSDWELRQFETDIDNMNNSGTSMSDNPGLAGYYEMKVTKHDDSTETSVKSESENDRGISTQYHTYDDLDIDIYPYFNGRYLSKMTLSFYVIEQDTASVSALFAKYTKTKYVVTIKFSWDNKNRNITTTATSVTISPGNFNYSLDRTMNTIGGYERLNIHSGNEDWNKLSLIDRSISNEFIRIYEYFTGLTEQTAISSRVDYNKLQLNLNDIMSDIEIECTYSVQTFDVNVYNIIDTEKDNLIKMGGTSDYDTPYTVSTFDAAISQNAFGNGGAYHSYEQANTTYMATIPVDCAEGITDDTQFNVPYGYFIYGWGSYQLNLNADRPTGSQHSENVNQLYGGYKYIYTYGYYEVGKTGRKIVGKNDSTGIDDYDMQSSGILGDNITFSESLRLFMNFSEFKGYFAKKIDTKNNRDIIFTDYDEYQNQYINENVEIYGYYFASNKPTDMIFYVWDDATSKYIPYSENSTEYRSNYRTESSAFITELYNDKIIVKKQDEQTDYIVDKDSIAMIKYFVQFGVNATKFMNEDIYTLADISQNTPTNRALLDYITKTYWIYSQSYYAYYWTDPATRIKHYIYYDTSYDGTDESKFHGFYITDNGEPDGIKKYVEIVSSYSQSGSQTIEGLSMEYNGDSYMLDYDVLYDYNFRGADMYATANYDASRQDPTINELESYIKYYKIQELNDEALKQLYGDEVANWPEIFRTSERLPRFYTKIEGTTLFLVIPNNPDDNVFNFYTLSGDSFVRFNEFNINITTLNNYYVHMGDVFYPIVSESYTDGGGSTFINPYLLENSVYIDSYKYYLNYEEKALYKDGSFTDGVRDANMVVYCAVNENYTILYEYDMLQARWIIDGVSITKLLSPHVSAWLGLDRYSFVGYIQIDDNDLRTLKSDSSGLVDNDHQRIMDVFEDRIKDNPHSAEIRESIQQKLEEFELDDLLSSLLMVDKYNYDEVTQNLDSIRVKINVTIHDVTWHEGEEVKTQDMSAIVSYTFPTVKLATVVLRESVYAIPIYRRNIVEFTDNSVSVQNGTVNIDATEMNLSHFESESNRIHIYDEEVGDYVQYAVLSEEEYLALKTTNKDNVADYLNSIIANLQDTRLFDGLENTSASIDFTKFAETGKKYYLIAFYYKYGTEDLEKRLVNRISDNCVEITYNNGEVTINNRNLSIYS